MRGPRRRATSFSRSADQQIVDFPVSSLADLRAKAAYTIRMHTDCDESVEETLQKADLIARPVALLPAEVCPDRSVAIQPGLVRPGPAVVLVAQAQRSGMSCHDRLALLVS